MNQGKVADKLLKQIAVASMVAPAEFVEVGLKISLLDGSFLVLNLHLRFQPKTFNLLGMGAGQGIHVIALVANGLVVVRDVVKVGVSTPFVRVDVRT